MSSKQPTKIDFQAYLLPKSDVWALSLNQTIELLDYLETMKIRQVYCIPPVRIENPENTVDLLMKTFEELQEHYSGGVVLKLSAKYRLDAGFITLLNRGNLMTIGSGKQLLVDVSPLKEADGLWQMLESALRAGYTPVVMQPERTVYWGTEHFVRLTKMGCKLMLNLYSLFGYNGDEALNYSRLLLKKKMYTYLFSGMEDTKVMRFSEQIKMDQDMVLINAVQALEENNGSLWSVNESEQQRLCAF